MKKLSERLAWARSKKGYTQSELGKLSGVTAASIGNLESGIRLTSRSITSIAAALDVDPTWLATGKGDSKIGAAPQKIHHEILAVVKIMESIDDDGKTLIRIKATEVAHLRSDYLRTMEMHRQIAEIEQLSNANDDPSNHALPLLPRVTR